MHCAALLSQYRRAGWQPPILDNSPFTPCQSETLPPCTSKAFEFLRQILREENSEIQGKLLREWLYLAQTAGQRTPFEILPLLLNKGRENKQLIPYLITTIGQRGHWLAKLNPEWQYIVDIQIFDKSNDVWETGNHAGRLAYLQWCRATEPAHARELLAASWQENAAQERQDFLTTFWTQLSLEDEDFLENCFNDRSLAVRQLAAQMLGNLAGSRLSTQLLERLSHYMILKKARLKTILEINLPAYYDKTWAREGIKEKPPSYPTMGEKMGWLYQMLLLIRPSLLIAHLDLSIDAYLKVIGKTDFADVLSQALLAATQAHKDGTVATELIYQSRQKDFFNGLTQLVEVFSAEERETVLQEYLKRYKTFTGWHQVNQMIKLFPEGFSTHSSQILLTAGLPSLLKKNQPSSHKHSALSLLAVTLASASYDEIKAASWLQNDIVQENFLKIYHFRYQMNQEFKQ